MGTFWGYFFEIIHRILWDDMGYYGKIRDMIWDIMDDYGITSYGTIQLERMVIEISGL